MTMTAGIPFSLTMTIGLQVNLHQERLRESITTNTAAASSFFESRLKSKQESWDTRESEREREREREVQPLLSSPLKKHSYSVGFASRLPVFLPSLSSSSSSSSANSSSSLFPSCSLTQPLCCVSRLFIAATRWLLLLLLCDQKQLPQIPPKTDSL